MFVGVNAAPKTIGVVGSYSDLTDGQMAFLDVNNAAQSSLSGIKVFRIAVRNGTSLLYSPFIKTSTVAHARTTNTVADTQQVTYLGYNGSTGSITAIGSNDYVLRIVFKGRTSTYGTHPVLKDAPFYSSPSALVTENEVAFGLLASLNANFAREPMPLIQFDLISNAAVTTANRFAHAATVVKGLTTFTVAANLTYNSSGSVALLAVGDYVRLGSVAGGTALTSPTYKVTAINTLTVTVDRPITNASGTYEVATYDAEVIPAASIGAHYGIKFTGIAENNFVADARFNHEVVEFNLVPMNFYSGDIVTYSTVPVVGKGTYQQVAETFAFAQGNWGKENRLGIPIPTPITPAVAGTAYNLIYFDYYNDDAAYLAGNPKSPGEIIIALADNTTNNNYVLDVLQGETTYFPTATGACADFT